MVGDGPLHEGLDGREQRVPELRQFVVDSRGDDGEHRARHQPIPLELTKGQGEHALTDAVDLSLEFAEPASTTPEQRDDQDGPFVADEIESPTRLARPAFAGPIPPVVPGSLAVTK